MSIITRFPPSPTGYLHIGRARTALFNYLFTKRNNGKMVFRIEDTDRVRSKKEYEADIIECLNWLGIKYDSGPFRQSERGEIYSKYIQKLIDSGHAYISDDASGEGDMNDHDPEESTPFVHSKKNTSEKRTQVIRFKNPNKIIKFNDLIRGDIEFDTSDLKDFVIAKSLNEPLYHLTVVVDDCEMGITHVIRGEDGISNTPRQILIQEAIGASRPIYAHLPLILAPDKSKLSGRYGAVSVTEYRKSGYLPAAIINFLGLLGWNPGTEQEIFSMDELINSFDLSKVNKSGAVFNIEKLNWYNRQYIQKLSDSEFTECASSFLPDWLTVDSQLFTKILPILREKIVIFKDVTDLLSANGELAFVGNEVSYSKELLLWKKNPNFDISKKHLTSVLAIIESIDQNNFTSENIKNAIWSYAEANGKGDVLWPTRVALTGQDKSPDPFTSFYLLGKEVSIQRLNSAINML